MTRMRQYLPYPKWPEEDRRLWDTAFKKGEGPFDDWGLTFPSARSNSCNTPVGSS
jgi:hypothetical protein